MNTKKCNKCKETKQKSAFTKDKNFKDGLSWRCKKCASKKSLDYYYQNKKLVLKRHRVRHRAFSKSWERVIPAKTKCQVCGKKIYFNKGKWGDRIRFDHRNGGNELIKGSPKDWLRTNLCTPQNERIWKKCNFGMLCLGCNRSLKTLNREQWLIGAIKYCIGNSKKLKRIIKTIKDE